MGTNNRTNDMEMSRQKNHKHYYKIAELVTCDWYTWLKCHMASHHAQPTDVGAPRTSTLVVLVPRKLLPVGISNSYDCTVAHGRFRNKYTWPVVTESNNPFNISINKRATLLAAQASTYKGICHPWCGNQSSLNVIQNNDVLVTAP